MLWPGGGPNASKSLVCTPKHSVGSKPEVGSAWDAELKWISSRKPSEADSARRVEEPVSTFPRCLDGPQSCGSFRKLWAPGGGGFSSEHVEKNFDPALEIASVWSKFAASSGSGCRQSRPVPFHYKGKNRPGNKGGCETQRGAAGILQ